MIFTLEAEVEPLLVHRLTILGRWELTVADDVYIRRSLTFRPNFCNSSHPYLLQEVVHRLIKHVDINKKHRIRRVFPFVLLDIVLRISTQENHLVLWAINNSLVFHITQNWAIKLPRMNE
jgi:hypothetical protein